MASFANLTCEHCGEQFAAHPDGNAAATGYCSPACETAGEGLA